MRSKTMTKPPRLRDELTELDVPCPQPRCRAGIGQDCTWRSSGKQAFHAGRVDRYIRARRDAAVATVHYVEAGIEEVRRLRGATDVLDDTEGESKVWDLLRAGDHRAAMTAMEELLARELIG